MLTSQSQLSQRSKIKPILRTSSCPKTKNLPFKSSIQNITIDNSFLNSTSPSQLNSYALKLAKSKSLVHLNFSSFITKLAQAYKAAIILKHLPNVKSLQLRFCLPSTPKLKKTLNILTYSFRKSHYLASLELEFGFANFPNFCNIRKFSCLLQTMRNITSLTINRFTQTPSSGNSLQILLNHIQMLPSLSSLSINFYKGYLDNQQVDILCSGLKSCKALTTLDLNLQACFNLTNQGIENLMLTASKDLEVSFFRLNLSVLSSVGELKFYQDIDSVLKPAKKDSFPSDLKVSYSYRGVLQLTIFQFSLKSLRTGKPKNFYVRFHQIDDMKVRYKEKVTRDLQLNLPCLKFIKTLELCLLGYYGKENFSCELAACIKSMESLENLTFDINAGLTRDFWPRTSLEIESSWFVNAFGELKNRPQLATIKLKLQNFTFDEKQIQYLSECLSKVRMLRELRLDFCKSNVPQTTIEVFAKMKLKNFNKFSLALA